MKGGTPLNVHILLLFKSMIQQVSNQNEFVVTYSCDLIFGCTMMHFLVSIRELIIREREDVGPVFALTGCQCPDVCMPYQG